MRDEEEKMTKLTDDIHSLFRGYVNGFYAHKDSHLKLEIENKRLKGMFGADGLEQHTNMLIKIKKLQAENKYRRKEQAKYYNSAENRIKCLEQKLDTATTLIKNLRVFNPELVDAWFKAIDKGE